MFCSDKSVRLLPYPFTVPALVSTYLLLPGPVILYRRFGEVGDEGGGVPSLCPSAGVGSGRAGAQDSELHGTRRTGWYPRRGDRSHRHPKRKEVETLHGLLSDASEDLPGTRERNTSADVGLQVDESSLSGGPPYFSDWRRSVVAKVVEPATVSRRGRDYEVW